MSSDARTRTRESLDRSHEDLLETCSEVADILRSPRRVRLLNALAEHGGPIDKGDLAREIARREIGADELPSVSSKEYSRVYTGCLQTHFRRLVDEEIIEWSEDEHNSIVPGPEFERCLSGLHALALSQGLPVESDLGGVSDGE